jgi:hypothetical protein
MKVTVNSLVITATVLKELNYKSSLQIKHYKVQHSNNDFAGYLSKQIPSVITQTSILLLFVEVLYLAVRGLYCEELKVFFC